MFRGISINADGEFVDGRLAKLEALLERYQAAGFDAVEVSVVGLGCIRSGELIPAQVERVRTLLSGFGLGLTLHAPNELNLLRGSQHLRVMAAVLDLAHLLGATCVVYHSGQTALHDPARHLAPLPSDEGLAAMWEQETEQLVTYGQRAAEMGLTLAVENRDPHLWEISALAMHGRPASELARYHQGMCLDQLVRQMQAIGLRSVGICLDVGHAHLARAYWPELDYLAAVKACVPWVKHVHLHDNWGRIDDTARTLGEQLVFGEADNHLPPGWGRIPLQEVLAILLSADYGGYLVVEIRQRYHDHLEEALANTRRYVVAVRTQQAHSTAP